MEEEAIEQYTINPYHILSKVSRALSKGATTKEHLNELIFILNMTLLSSKTTKRLKVKAQKHLMHIYIKLLFKQINAKWTDYLLFKLLKHFQSKGQFISFGFLSFFSDPLIYDKAQFPPKDKYAIKSYKQLKEVIKNTREIVNWNSLAMNKEEWLNERASNSNFNCFLNQCCQIQEDSFTSLHHHIWNLIEIFYALNSLRQMPRETVMVKVVILSRDFLESDYLYCLKPRYIEVSSRFTLKEMDRKIHKVLNFFDKKDKAFSYYSIRRNKRDLLAEVMIRYRANQHNYLINCDEMTEKVPIDFHRSHYLIAVENEQIEQKSNSGQRPVSSSITGEFFEDYFLLNQKPYSVEDISHLNINDLLLTKQGNSLGLPGLENQGNQCYMSAVFQCLSNTVLMTKYFLFHFFERDLNNTPNQVIVEEYYHLIKKLWLGKNRASLSPKKLRNVFIERYLQFNNFSQQDSYEFLSVFFEALNVELIRNDYTDLPTSDIASNSTNEEVALKNKEEPRPKSIITELFYGCFNSNVECTNCNSTITLKEAFNVLQLPIPSKYHHVSFLFLKGNYTRKKFNCTIFPRTTIQQLKDIIIRENSALNLSYDSIVNYRVSQGNQQLLLTQSNSYSVWTDYEQGNYFVFILASDEGYFNMSSVNSSYLAHRKEPMLLSLNSCIDFYQLKEQVSGFYCAACKSKQTINKSTQISQYPRYLLIQFKRFQYSTGFVLSFGSKSTTCIDFPLNPLIVFDEVSKAEVRYELYAMINHNNTYFGRGHYYAICRNAVTNKWVKYDDGVVEEDVNISSALKESYTNAYILFYQKLEK